MDLIYDQLKHIPEKDFEEAVDDYVGVDRPPDNFIGFIKRRAFEIKQSRESRPVKFEKGELSETDMKIFMLCIQKAMAARKMCKLNFEYWVIKFNREFDQKSGKELSEWLFASLSELNELLRAHEQAQRAAVKARIAEVKRGGGT